MMSQPEAPTVSTSFYKLPPIITTERDREFLKDVNTFIETELNEVNDKEPEQRFLVYKAAFNKVIDYTTIYKPVLAGIQKQYEDTIEAIKKEQQESIFLQGKLRAMASEPTTLLNYKKQADELEERVAKINKDNERLQKELADIQASREEREKRPQTVEVPTQQFKKDTRPIPGLPLDQTTDMKVLRKKYESLDRQLKEINNSLKTRFLPKSHKSNLKESLEDKVLYRDQLLLQNQMYKARGQKLKLALEAANAYNQVKPPHQTVGDAVTSAFQQTTWILKDDKEKVEGEQAEATTLEEDDPEMQQEAEMMLEYIEKFNELFEDGLFEEAAVHAANSPKGILRTQATLAKFRDVKIHSQGRSPLFAFCDVLMSSVKAAGSKPKEALSRDCVEAALKENCPDLLFHWLAQDRLTVSFQLGKMISDHCSCSIPCSCGCQAMAEIILAMLKQGKVHSALHYARLYNCITNEVIQDILGLNVCQEFVNGLMEVDLSGKKPYLNLRLGVILECLAAHKKHDLAADLVLAMLKPATENTGRQKIFHFVPGKAVTLDKETTKEQWMKIIQNLDTCGQQEVSLQLLAITTVLNVINKAITLVQDDKKGISFSMTPDVSLSQTSPKPSILKKRADIGSAKVSASSKTSARNSLSTSTEKKNI
ncbi:unnamed protein product [Candidula unifasciata]|uniref:Translin-associated factor X-interacting protein 1 N-terminal domain-containing protein n=1 Tax=Candidula unifasciata TaxID=100452 RepID=A0A8S4ABT5_9EUPU|nr:unnamed protein product [Candidula unifasciata]